jgi:hypothetical protein
VTDNPYNPSRPIADPTHFFGREDALGFLTLHLSGRRTHKALVILGQRGMGKSSLLTQVPLVVDERYPSVRIDAAALELDNIVAFVATIVDRTRAMMNAIQASTYRLPAFPDPTDPDIDLLGWLADEYFEIVFSAIRRARHLVLMIDNLSPILDAIERGDFPPDFMDYWQDLLEHYEQLDMVVTVDIADEARILQTAPMDDTSLHYRLQHLSPEEARRALVDPAQMHYGFTEEAIAQILRLAGGHPYHLQSIGHLLHRRWEEDRNRINIMTPHDVNAIFPAALEFAGDTIGDVWEILRPNERLILTSLLDLGGPVFPDDIQAWLISADHVLDDVQISAALRGLEYYGVLLTNADGAHGFAAEIQAEWLRHKQDMPAPTTSIPPTAESPNWLYISGGVAVVVVALALLLIFNNGDEPNADNANAAGATITLETDAQRTLNAAETMTAAPVPTTTPTLLPPEAPVFRFGG